MQTFVRAKEKTNQYTCKCENSHLNILQLCRRRFLMIIYEYYVYCGPTVIRRLFITVRLSLSFCLSAPVPVRLPLRVVSTVVVNFLFEGVLSRRQLFIVFYVIWRFLNIQNYNFTRCFVRVWDLVWDCITRSLMICTPHPILCGW